MTKETENLKKMIISQEIDRSELFGNLDANIRILKENLEVDVMQRDNELILRGKDADKPRWESEGN